MINAYSINKGQFSVDRVETESPTSEGMVWLDVVEPSKEEYQWLNKNYPGCLPDEDEMHEIEVSSRFFESEHGIHIRSLFPHRSGHELKNVNIAFELRGNKLITLQDESTALFRLMRNYLKTQHVQAETPLDIILSLFNAKAEYLADTLEEIYETLEEASKHAMAEETFDADELLRTITLQEDLNGKVRLNLLDTQRSLRYLIRSCNRILSEEQRDEVRDILRDLESLTPHTTFLFEKINFLMEAAMGFINLEQNSIIKIFSFAAVIFLPPTLIASIYGMNFESMPELHTKWGYPMALTFMLMSALVTFLFFKRKNWL